MQLCPSFSPRRLATAISFLLIFGSASRGVSAQTVRDDIWVANDLVYSLATDGKTLYLGGYFTLVGPVTGKGVPVDLGSGQTRPGFPYVDGAVSAVVSDGAGGWFIGGKFQSVGGQVRGGLAHLTADLKVSAWDANASLRTCGGCDPGVSALLISGTTLYVAGDFSALGGVACNDLGAVDVITGAARNWTPQPNEKVLALALRGSTLYVGGRFTAIGDRIRNHIAAVDVVTGVATAWNPNVNDHVTDLALGETQIYAAGQFDSVGAERRPQAAGIDLTTGLATSWNPVSDGLIEALAVRGSTVYVGGLFFHLGNQERKSLAAVDATSGAVLDWNPGSEHPDLSGRGWIATLVATDSRLYVGGLFDRVAGQRRDNVAAFDLTSGNLTGWDPMAADRVSVIAVDNTGAYLGGDFTSVGGARRKNLAAFDLATGAATGWNPEPNREVTSLAFQAGKVFASGPFSTIGGQARSGIAAFDATTGAISDWNPIPNGQVRAFALGPSTAYISGAFNSVGGQPRDSLAEVDLVTGAVTGWNPVTNGRVTKLLVTGETVFAVVEGVELAAIGAVTGQVRDWHPRFVYDYCYYSCQTSVDALASRGNVLYVGGQFTKVDNVPRSLVAAFDMTSGALLPALVSRSVQGLEWVTDLAISGSTMYMGGAFSYVADSPRKNLAALDLESGALESWAPSASSWVYCMTTHGADVYVGGLFADMNGAHRPHIAAFVDPTTPAHPASRKWGKERKPRPGPPRSPADEVALRVSNPVRGHVEVTFSLAQPGRVGLSVVDLQGRVVARIADSYFAAGPSVVQSSLADQTPPGLYFVTMERDGQRVTRPFVVLK